MSHAVVAVPHCVHLVMYIFFFQAEDGIRDRNVTGVQTCALPISLVMAELDRDPHLFERGDGLASEVGALAQHRVVEVATTVERRSEEHTSELQSRFDLVCRLLLEKKKKE